MKQECVLLAARQLGLPVTDNTRTIKCHHRAVIFPVPEYPESWSPFPWRLERRGEWLVPATVQFSQVQIDLVRVFGMPGIQALGYNAQYDVLAWRPEGQIVT